MDPDKRNVTAIKLRGEKSDGIYLPIECLAFTGAKLEDFKPGDTIDVVNKIEICKKYIPRSNKTNRSNEGGNRTRKHKVDIAPLFKEHADTEQLAYNLSAFKPGDEIEITLKMHGTSQRTAHVPTLKGYKRTFWDRICGRPGTPVYEYGYVTGTRRCVLEPGKEGYYGSNEFREQHAAQFEGKLAKGETVYYEVVGYTQDGGAIMPPAANSKTKDKEFIKKYGDTTHFSYGCSPTGTKTMHGKDETSAFTIEEKVPQSDIYVYRMTMITPEEYIIEYPPYLIRNRCSEMNIKSVPLFEKFIIPSDDKLKKLNMTAGEYVKTQVNKYLNTDPDPIGKTHIKEGVVVRIVNRSKFTAFKDKVFEFKVLEGIIKSELLNPDMEEVENFLDETE